MILLRFVATNHKSLRDRTELDLRRSAMQTLRPRPGESWLDYVYPVAGIFGANASGKSTIIDALNFTFSAIRSSATSWQESPRMVRVPFALDDRSRDLPSVYELDFVLDGIRYEYGFEIGPDGVRREWLRDLPGKQWRSLLRRDTHGAIHTHASVKALGSVTSRELALSRAILLRQGKLASVGRALLSGFDIAPMGDAHRERRLSSITESLANGVLTFDDIVTLLKLADIGVEQVAVQEKTLPPEAIQLVESIRRLIEGGGRSEGEGDEGNSAAAEVTPENSDAVVRNLEFTHRGEAEAPPKFSIQDESDGTIAWLALVVPAVDVLKRGGLFCVDEIDASLHSYLVETLISFFADPQVNRTGAQLIFTSHDTFLLSPMSDTDLDPEQVWLTQKDRTGATELFCLADFPRHKDANHAKRYLSGRYGAVPRVAPSVILRVLDLDPAADVGQVPA